MVVNYTNLKLPEELVEEVRRYIEKHPEKGYVSAPDFVRDAIREKLDQ